MLVAMPTAIPADPLTSRLGTLEGRTSGSFSVPSKLSVQLDRLLLDVEEHLLRDRGQAGLGVPHRGRRVPVDRAEVPLAVDERVAEAERLGHADEGVVDGEVAVGVVLAEDVADRARALPVRPVVGRARLPHRPEDATVDRLEAVPAVGERPSDDDAHRVIDVGVVHLPLERAGRGSGRTGGGGPGRGACPSPRRLRSAELLRDRPVGDLEEWVARAGRDGRAAGDAVPSALSADRVRRGAAAPSRGRALARPGGGFPRPLTLVGPVPPSEKTRTGRSGGSR